MPQVAGTGLKILAATLLDAGLGLGLLILQVDHIRLAITTADNFALCPSGIVSNRVLCYDFT
ncbi:MAG: hypothetical protein WCJ35_06225, partial [Planctomycetota bacterium]